MVKNLYTSANGAYVAPALVALYSAARHAQADLVCTLVTDADLGGFQVDRLRTQFEEQNARLEFFDWTTVDTGIEPSILARVRYSSLSMAWIFVDQIFPEARRAVYIDSDTMALSSIEDLFAFDLSENATAAVFDYGILPKNTTKDQAHLLGQDTSQRQFNSGVLVQNIAEYRARGIGNACVEYLNGNPDSIDNFADQDTLNVVCRGRIREMSPVYNAHPAYADVIRSVCGRDPVIVHYWGGRKPWKANFFGIRMAYLEAYFDLVFELGVADHMNNSDRFRSTLGRGVVAVQSRLSGLVKKKNSSSVRAYYEERITELTC
ncbi:MAG: glycosyltransferase family 8 protein [Hyphomicrobiaceae bacterium]